MKKIAKTKLEDEVYKYIEEHDFVCIPIENLLDFAKHFVSWQNKNIIKEITDIKNGAEQKEIESREEKSDPFLTALWHSDVMLCTHLLEILNS